MLFRTMRLLVCAALVVVGVLGGMNGAMMAQDGVEVAKPVVISPQVKELLKPVEPMLGRTTYLVAHADLQKIDIDTIVASWKRIVTKCADKLKADENFQKMMKESMSTEVDPMDIDTMVAEFFAKMDEGTPEAKKTLEKIRKAGLKEIYVVAHSQTMMQVPSQFVLIIEKGTADAVLEAIQFEPGMFDFMLIEKQEDRVVLNFVSPGAGLTPGNETDTAKIKQMLGRLKPMDRPEFAAAFEKIKNAPVQIAFVPDGALKGMIPMGLMMAPPPHNEIKSSVIINGAKWVSVGVDPMRMIFAETIQSASPEAAQEFYKLAISTIDEAIAAQMKDAPPDMVEQMETIKKVVDTFKVFIPKVKGDQLQLVINEKFLDEEGDAIVAAGSLMLPAIQAAREAARRMQCSNNLKQIVLSLHNYYDVNQQFPPVYTVDANGKPLHSWRVLLLLFMEQQTLYNKIRLDEPWDSEFNKQFHNRMPSIYQCSSNPQKGMTNYSVVTGKETAFPFPPKKMTFGSITDGTSNTVFLVERETPVCWMDPTQEITFEEAIKGINNSSGVGSKHTQGMNAAWFDGSVQYISETIDPVVWKALLTIAGGENASY